MCYLFYEMPFVHTIKVHHAVAYTLMLTVLPVECYNKMQVSRVCSVYAGVFCICIILKLDTAKYRHFGVVVTCLLACTRAVGLVMAMGYGVDSIGIWVQFLVRARDFCFSTAQEQRWGPSSHLFSVCGGGWYFCKGKCPGHEAVHSLLFSAEVKSMQCIHPLPHMS